MKEKGFGLCITIQIILRVIKTKRIPVVLITSREKGRYKKRTEKGRLPAKFETKKLFPGY
jgi:hypothetical protein